ncbi:MAG: hypothetical protein K2N20_04755 [Helicobacter sp.]|nr:hypothetical protein [Helicobacter sp.]
MRTNRNKAISHYQKEANLLRDEYEDYDEEEQDTSEIPTNEDAPEIATKPVQNTSASQPASAETLREGQRAEGAPESTDEQEGENTDPSAPAICPHVLSVYETVMLIQLKRMIKRNTKAFAVMLKILIQGDPKRKKEE